MNTHIAPESTPLLPNGPLSVPPQYTAFVAGQRVATGSLIDVARALATLSPHGEQVFVFDEQETRLVDPPRADATVDTAQAVKAGPGKPGAPEAIEARAPAAAPAVGRPKLGVVAREVTLLPRHWEWLNAQPGGASASLRRLVEEARRNHADADARRVARERTFRFLNAVAGNRPGFEEAARLLFSDQPGAFDSLVAQMQAWPEDVQAYALTLARPAFSSSAAPAR